MPPVVLHRDRGEVLETPWALLPETLARIADLARTGADSVAVPTELVVQGRERQPPVQTGGVAVVPVYGVIDHRSSWLQELFGGASVEGVRQDLQAALADPSITAVLLDIDSPGGSVAGVTELAQDIRNARGGRKPIIAIANTMMASAAYWLGSQADEVVATPSASVGAIGIYAVHQEVSRMLDEMGVTTTVISAGPYKVEANEYQPLTDDAKQALQERVDSTYSQFLADVGAGRRIAASDVEDKFGGGRVFPAKKALSSGMVDRVASFSQTIARLGKVATSRSFAGASFSAPDLEAAAIAPHETDTTDATWDGSANEMNLPSGDGAASTLKAAHAWVDDAGDPNMMSSYKFLHHMVTSDGTVGDANMAACSSGIDVLNGSQAGIPQGDKQGVYDHLAEHLEDGGQTAVDFTGELPFSQRIQAYAQEGASLVAHARERSRLRAKEGRPAFSTAIETALRTSRDAISALLDLDDPGQGEDKGHVQVKPAQAPPVDPARTTPLVAATTTAKQVSREDFLSRYLYKE